MGPSVIAVSSGAGVTPAHEQEHKRLMSLSSFRRYNLLNGGSPTFSPRNAQCVQRVEDYCTTLGGSRPISSVLIANNGIAAVKFIRSVRMWSYETFGNDRMVLLVAMATPQDMRVNAEHIRMADQFVEVPGGTNNNNYANVQLIVEVAERTKVDAVWPGWGHASEVPALPEALGKRGIIFLGPPAGPMAALGDKIGSSIIAQAAGVPTLPWSGSHVKLPVDKCGDPIPEDIYRQACVQTTEEAIKCCQQIGYPIMIKASWGGGGKGIRKVHSDEEVRAVFKQVQGEVPGSPIFLMKLATQCRHLEVQLVCDVHGNVAALHSRDCSVQRRHQKIIEEGPITVAPLETVRELERGACRLAACVGYAGAATVEYLYSMETGEFFFLELNPRLQVEHPVTEWIANVNLPATQLAIGMGIPLWRMPEIRRLYGQSLGGSLSAWQAVRHAPPFDFTTAQQVPPKGHVVAVRVTSEDPDDGFKPTSGRIQELSFRSKPDVWAYFSVKSGGGIHEFSDSQFGHLFAFGETRGAAISNMVLALKDVHIRGEIRTIVDYAVDLLHDAEYQGNRIHTGWLDARIAMRLRVEPPPWHLSVIAGALYSATSTATAAVSEYMSYLEKGQIPPKNLSLLGQEVSLNIEGHKYTVQLTRRSPTCYHLRLNESEVEAEAHKLHDGGLLVQLDGNSHVVYAEEEAGGTRLLISGRTCVLQRDHDPSRLLADTASKLLRYLLPDGSHVEAEAAYAEVEVMKMCMPLLAPAAGTLHFQLCEGQAMQAGDLVARLDLDDPTSVKRAQPFRGALPPLGPPTAYPAKAHKQLATALDDARMVLAGYQHDCQEVVGLLARSLADEQLPALQWLECFAVHANRLPKDLREQLEAAWASHRETEETTFCGSQLREILEAYASGVAETERALVEPLLAPLLSVVRSHEAGREAFAATIVHSLLEEYLRVEEPFSLFPAVDVVEALRQEHKQQLSKVLDVVLSHQAVQRKSDLVLVLLAEFVAASPAKYQAQLQRLASLSHGSYSLLALEAGRLLERTRLKELRQTVARSLSESELSSLVLPGGAQAGLPGQLPHAKSIEAQMASLVDAPQPIEDALTGLFDHRDHTLQARAVEAYLRRLYQPYLPTDSVISIQWEGPCLISTWRFWEERSPSDPAAPTVTPRPGPQTLGIERWGAMVVVPSLELISSAVGAALKETCGPDMDGLLEGSAAKGREGEKTVLPAQGHAQEAAAGLPSGFGNALHVVSLLKMDEEKAESGEQSAQEVIGELAEALLRGAEGQALRQVAGVGVVSCMLQPSGEGEAGGPLRKSFHWSEALQHFTEEPLLNHLEPPLADLLETEKLQSCEGLRYTRSRDRQWHIYSFTDRPSGIRRAFLRALVRVVPPKAPAAPAHCPIAAAMADLPTAAAAAAAFPPAALPNGKPPISRNGSIKNENGGSPGRDAQQQANGSVPGGSQSAVEATLEALQRAIQGGLEELELAAHHVSADRRAEHVHLFMSVLRAVHLDSARGSCGQEGVEATAAVLEGLARAIDAQFASKMVKVGVLGWEARLRVKGGGSSDGAWRIVASNPSGHAVSVHVYREAVASAVSPPGGSLYLSPQQKKGPLHGTPLLAPYAPLGKLDRRRLAARKQGTTYVYDFPMVFEAALASAWAEARQAHPSLPPPPPGEPLFHARELIFADATAGWGSPLAEAPPGRLPRTNTVGMIGWSMHMKTPEFPSGRTIFVVANDATFSSGAFGPSEDAFFQALTSLACEKRLPLVYLAANSGARIGLAEEVRACFRVGWSDDAAPGKGFQYLYLTPQDYARVGGSVRAKKIHVSTAAANGGKQGDSEEVRYMITDVIGAEDGLGVECLSGSGAIAGAFSRAYAELPFTLTFVTGRTVGIGAYLARLGVRCIQRMDRPIILTGYSALNKLLGREVYTSHMQLGGPKVMAANGVVHQTVGDDGEGVSAILRWLAYVPAVGGGPLPTLPSSDPIHRLVGYTPETSCDPRAAIAGVDGPGGSWAGGLFDRGSFTETWPRWAQTVVTGRARLGGVPVGVVAVEVKTVLQTIPADPGQPDTHERVQPQAGQVWFPDSASKTAQALRDFDREGLPLFILANWRGFSGGQRDLFEGILQAGSLIVEQLRVYRRPAFVYIPKAGELRGGAWVVIDSKINPAMLEMYADESARGGVLEPEGVVEIKFRERELFRTMHRLDEELIRLDGIVQDPESWAEGEAEECSEIAEKIRAREKALLPVYKQIAIKFAELHDTPQRMVAKGAIRAVIPWARARLFFALRLRRRLAEESLVECVQAAAALPPLHPASALDLQVKAGMPSPRLSAGGISHKAALGLVYQWFSQQEGRLESQAGVAEGWELPGEAAVKGLVEEDAAFLEWSKANSEQIEDCLLKLRAELVAGCKGGPLDGTTGSP